MSRTSENLRYYADRFEEGAVNKVCPRDLRQAADELETLKEELRDADRSHGETIKKHNELVDKLWNAVNGAKELGPSWVIERVQSLLPPRETKYEEVPWHEAIEGLRSGKYKRAKPTAWTEPYWTKWDNCLRYENGNTTFPFNDCLFDTWKAELA